MSIEEFLAWVGERPIVPIAFFLLIPAVAWFFGLVHSREASARSPWKYVYSTLVYLSAAPGVFAAVIVAYTFLFTRDSLLKLDLVVTFLPLLSMIVTMVLIARRVDLDRLPGFERLWGLITLLAVSFVIALVLDRLRVWLFFGGGMLSLVVIAAILYLLLRTAAKAVAGRSR
jgi:hypothetical protein